MFGWWIFCISHIGHNSKTERVIRGIDEVKKRLAITYNRKIGQWGQMMEAEIVQDWRRRKGFLELGNTNIYQMRSEMVAIEQSYGEGTKTGTVDFRAANVEKCIRTFPDFERISHNIYIKTFNLFYFWNDLWKNNIS